MQRQNCKSEPYVSEVSETKGNPEDLGIKSVEQQRFQIDGVEEKPMISNLTQLNQEDIQVENINNLNLALQEYEKKLPHKINQKQAEFTVSQNKIQNNYLQQTHQKSGNKKQQQKVENYKRGQCLKQQKTSNFLQQQHQNQQKCSDKSQEQIIHELQKQNFSQISQYYNKKQQQNKKSLQQNKSNQILQSQRNSLQITKQQLINNALRLQHDQSDHVKLEDKQNQYKRELPVSEYNGLQNNLVKKQEVQLQNESKKGETLIIQQPLVQVKLQEHGNQYQIQQNTKNLFLQQSLQYKKPTLNQEIPNQLQEKINQLQNQLDLTEQIIQQGEGKVFEIKKQKLLEKVQQIKNSIQQIDNDQQYEEQFKRQFIAQYQQQLQKADQLLKTYQQKYQNNTNDKLLSEQLNEGLVKLKIKKINNEEILKQLNQKLKKNGDILKMYSKKQKLAEKQTQAVKKLKQYQENINRLKQLITILYPCAQSTAQNELQKIKRQASKVKNSPEQLLFFIYRQKQIGKIKIDLSKNIQQLLRQLKVQTIGLRLKYFLKKKQDEESKQISTNLIKQKLQSILQKPLNCNYVCQIQQMITVRLDNGEQKQFKKGIDLDQILKKLKIRSRNYYFFKKTAGYAQETAEYTQVTALQDLQLKQCQVCNIRYLGCLIKQVLIPIHLKPNQAINYIPFDKFKQGKLQTAYLGKIKFQGTQIFVNNKQTLQMISKQNKIEEIVVEYKINLKVQIITLKKSRQVDFQVVAQKSIEELKKQFQKEHHVESKIQKWIFCGKELQNNLTFQSLQFHQCFLGIQVHQIIDLQYYGFSTQQQKINSALLNNFYIEDDQYFLQQLQKSEFPKTQFQFGFRVKALAKIFSCIKKHCRIKLALDSIKSIVAKSSKRCNLWMPPNSHSASFFNQNYVLFNIFNTSSSDLITEVCRTYKHHSCLPLKTRKKNGNTQSLHETHYWISTKSLCIVSLQINQKIQGKSTFLNKIFNTDFESSENRHPLCQKIPYIKYDIYRNSKYIVDLVDISSQSMSEKQKVQICKHANILMIHLYNNKADVQAVEKWIKQNCPNALVIFIFRDSPIIDDEQKYKYQMNKNNQSNKTKTYHLPQLSKQKIKYYQYKLCQVSDQINKFVVETQNNLYNQDKWLLSNYFQKQKPVFRQYTKKLKKLQNQFSTLIDLSLLTKQNQLNIEIMEQSSLTNQQKLNNEINVSQNIIQLVKIQQFQDISNFMAKLKQFSRIQRIKNLSRFDELQQIENYLQRKFEKQQIKDQMQAICKSFQILNNIDKNQKTQIFQKGLDMFEQNKNNLTYELLEKIYREYLQKQFQMNIIKKQFSIQNFWRVIHSMYLPQNQKMQNQRLEMNRKIIMEGSAKLFSIQFQKGKTIQLINGDTLKMPTQLFKIHESSFQGKNIMVIAIVGGQSSGKSTLLNFLFGCDFLSSQGRCTSGVYMTYYEVSGQNIPGCDGILVLDTEGLFGNFERKNKQGLNFDNKLVLFLLKTCDILIVNNRGDVQKNIQDILELSFDSQLMQYQPGMKYPNFNVVLNIRTGNFNSQNKNQIITLRKRIIEVNKQMQKYFSSQQSHSLPVAYPPKNQSGVSTFINSVQSVNKVATTQFYEQTRRLSLSLVNTLSKRGKNNSSHRTLSEIYQQMSSTWSMLIRLPILTKHLSKRLKQFDQKVHQFILKTSSQLQSKSKIMISEIPDKINLIQPWILNKQEQVAEYKKCIMNQFESQFMNKDQQKNNLARIAKLQIQAKLSSFQVNLKLQIKEKKYKIVINQSQNKGIEDLNKRARQLRCKDLSVQQKEHQFKKLWQKYTQELKTKNLKQKNSKELNQNIQLYYNDHVKQTNKMTLSRCQSQNDGSQSFQQFYLKKSKEFILRIPKINPLQSVQIPPVIVVQDKTITDLKYSYFDMRKFFQLTPTKFEYYINFNSLLELVDQNYFNNKQQIKIGKHEVIQNFFEYLEQDLSYFGIKIRREYIKHKLIQGFKNNYQNKSIQNIYISSYSIDVIDKQRHQKKVQQINNQTNPKKQPSSNQNKNQTKKPNSYSNNNFNKNIDIQNYQFQLVTKQQLRQAYRQKKPYVSVHKLYDWSGFYTQVIKQMVVKSIKRYIKQNQVLFKEFIQYIKSCFTTEIKQQLSKIGTYSLVIQRITQYLYRIKINTYQIKPIEVENKTCIMKIINNMNDCINIKKLTKIITDYKLHKSQCIAFSYENKIQIKQQFKNNTVLSFYKDKSYDSLNRNLKNKDFLDLAKKSMNFERILIKIKQVILSKPEQIKIKQYIKDVSIVIKNQLEDFNRDLKQISKIVSIDFQHLIHQFSKKLIWKKLQLQKIQQNNRILQKINKDEQQQKIIFLGILDTNSKPSCQINAKLLINAYRQHLQPYIIKQKQICIDQSSKQFLNQYTRYFIQTHVDQQIFRSKNQNRIYDYLKNPVFVFQQYYNQFIQKQIQKLKGNFKCQSRTSINQLLMILKQMSSKLTGTQLQSQFDMIFEQSYIKQKDKNQLGIQLKQLFVSLLFTGETITSHYKNNLFHLRQGIKFQITKAIQNQINSQFFKSAPVFEIFNFSYFIQNLEKQLSILDEQIDNSITFSSKQIDTYEQKAKLIICNTTCPCCDRLCDVDMRIDPHHTKHRIDSGHQMRAVKGMVVQKQINDKIELFASVIRCQDVLPKTKFQYYGKQYVWQNFVIQKQNQWSFKSKEINKVLFQHIWEICGKRICNQFTLKGKQMKHIQYSDGTIQFIQNNQNKQQNTQFIFAIDGSGSMDGSPWQTQIKQLKQVLNDISKDQTSTVSILVFNSACYPFCINQKASKIDVQQIKFPGGVTTPQPTFLKAAQIITDINKKGSKSVYFFYLSDGGASHPTEGIRELLRCKNQLKAKKLQFTYTSILIGTCGDGRQCMQAINSQMGGKSEYVANAGGISQKVKEILAQ